MIEVNCTQFETTFQAKVVIGFSPPQDELSIILTNLLADLEEAARTIEALNRRLAKLEGGKP